VESQTRNYVAEMLGTFTLVFIGSLSILAATAANQPLVLVASLGFGLALLAGLYAFGEISGGHFNPAVSLAMFFNGRLDASSLVRYVIAQLAGAILASLAVLTAFGQDDVAATATTATASWDAFWLELIMTAIFVSVILQSSRSQRVYGTALLAISLTLVAIHLAAIPTSGSSVNPARSLGPALVGNEWADFWIYLTAPLIGASIGAAIHLYLYGRYVTVDVETVEIAPAENAT
jgi:aquaporin Z